MSAKTLVHGDLIGDVFLEAGLDVASEDVYDDHPDPHGGACLAICFADEADVFRFFVALAALDEAVAKALARVARLGQVVYFPGFQLED